jgi:hypothetical protein
MAEPEDLRIEQAEDREWERVRETVEQAHVDLDETYDEYLARTANAQRIADEQRERTDRQYRDDPHFTLIEE